MERIISRAQSAGKIPRHTARSAGPLQRLADKSGIVSALHGLQAHANAQPRGAQKIVQRYVDLFSIYGEDYDHIENKQDWLQRFHAAQQALNVESNMTDSLEQLSADMIENSRTLQQALDAAMQEHWGAQDHALTGFVPARAFIALIQDGKLFRDYVGQNHGVHSHQLQWYTLMRVLGAEEAHALYREAGNPRWRTARDNKYMWDKIVDGTKSGDADSIIKPTDFTVPENLETYLLGRFAENAERPAEKSVSEAHEGQPDAAADFKWRYPKRSEYNDVLRQADQIYSAPDSSLLEKAQALNSIVDQRLTNTTGWFWNKKTIEWTGWHGTDGADAERPFEPTIAREQS